MIYLSNHLHALALWWSHAGWQWPLALAILAVNVLLWFAAYAIYRMDPNERDRRGAIKRDLAVRNQMKKVRVYLPPHRASVREAYQFKGFMEDRK